MTLRVVSVVFVAGLSSCAWGQACDDAAGVHLCVSSLRYSEPLSLGDLVDNRLEAVRSRGSHNLIYVRDEVRVGFGGAWGQFSVLARQVGTLYASSGAVNVVQDVKTPGQPADAYQENLKLKMVGFGGVGVALQSQPWRLGVDVDITAGAQWLQLRRMLMRDVVGEVTHLANSTTYALVAESQYVSNKIKFPYQQDTAARGHALLLNGTLRWRPDAFWQFDLRVTDWGRLWWRGMPQDDMIASSQTSAVDADGYIVYKPMIQGHYSQRNVARTSVATWRGVAHWRFQPAWSLELAVDRIDGFPRALPQIGVVYQTDRGIVWSAGWHEYEQMGRLGVSYKGFQLMLAADRWGGGAHARHALIQWAQAWP